MNRLRLLALLAAVSVVVAPSNAAGDERAFGDTTVFARVGQPGMPEGIAVRDGVVYVGTHTSVRGNGGEGPSKIFRYDLDSGALLGEITVEGQNLDATHGILAMAFDADGRLYVLDRNPPRVVRFDFAARTQETYATFPDYPACPSVAGVPLPQPPIECSPTAVDRVPFPDYLAFDADGNAYVTDLESAMIYVVPPGGGEAGIWFADARLDSVFGPNGIAVDPAGTKFYFAMTGSQLPTSPAQGVIYTLPLGPQQPAPGDLETFFTYLEPATGPDGIMFGASGKLYVALAGSNQLSVLNPDGTEAARFPTAEENAEDTVCEIAACTPEQSDVPYDLPASIAFRGDGSLLLTNQSYFTATESHWVVFDVHVDDVALPLIEPTLP